MPVDFTGYWKMLANENFEEYLRALGKPLLAELGPGAPREPVRGAPPQGLRRKGVSCPGSEGGQQASYWRMEVVKVRWW